MKIHFWGATDEVTGSMTFLELPEGIIMIDAGLAQGNEEIERFNQLPLPYSPKEIMAIILTHAHLDHSGYLPRLVKKGFHGDIHCTPATAKLAKIILQDSAKLNEEDFYNDKDVTETLHLFRTHEWNEKFDLLGMGIHFVSAGHILGASSVVIKAGDKRIVFSGDLGRQDDPILLPHSPCPEADVVIMESTYGGKKRPRGMEKDLHSFLTTISRESRVGIIASFAVSRAQNLLTLIHEFYERHPEEKIRMVIDSPMMSEANKVYQNFAHFSKIPTTVFEALDHIDSIDFQKEWLSLKKKSGPLLILSSSGMLTGGRIARHLYNWHEDKKAILFLPGFQSPGTPGRNIVEGKRTLMGPEGELFEWKGEVWHSESFSSHADHGELIDWLTHNNKTSKVFLLHGEHISKKALRESLPEPFDVHIPLRGSIFEI